MRNFILLVIITLSGVFCLAQNDRKLPDISMEDLNGEKKPWTNLNWNNNPYNFQFAIVTDRTGGHRPGIFEDGVRKLNLLQPEFVLSVGDLIEGYTEDLDELDRQWTEFNGFVDALEMPFFYVPGNHDITNKVMEDLWVKQFGTTYYYFVYGDVLFMCMNSEDQNRGAGRGTISDEQFEWAKKVLAAHLNVRWTFVFMHQPLWHQEDTKRWKDLESLLTGRKHTVFTGHEHRYVSEQRNNGNYYVLATTGGGSALRGAPLGEFDHVVWITMTEEGPVMVNLQLEGFWTENVVNRATKTRIETVANKVPFQIEPLYAKKTFSEGTVNVKITNDQDVPMTVKFQEGFSWDISGSVDQPTLEVAPNSVETVTLAIKNRRKTSIADLKPFKLKANVSYAFKDATAFEIPYTYYIKPEPMLAFASNKNTKKVDGELNDWSNLFYTLPTKDAKNLSAKFDITYDDNYLYIAADVKDDHLKSLVGSSVWSQDHIGFVVNADPLQKSAMNIGNRWFEESIFAMVTPQTPTGEVTADAKVF
ncbi:MAG: hypothetical protein HC892_03120 [Saprospiraceae bacterium]|nr:hypothetical protein [Saprospiraceae bacterium]